jgi:hypothetical protein
VYLRRNLRRVAPIAVIQALVTALLLVIITPTNVFHTTSAAYLRVMSEITIVTPRVKSRFDENLTALLDANPAMESRVAAKLIWMRTPMIVGDAYAPLVALDAEAQSGFLEHVGVRLVEGSLPAKGTPGVALHRSILRARELEIGDAFGQLVDPDDTTPGFFRVVGVLDGESRIGVVNLGYASIPDFVLSRREAFHVVYAKPGRKEESDGYLAQAEQADGKTAFRVIDDDYVRVRADRALKNLPLLIGFVTGAVAGIVALVTALLNVITFQARLDEFGVFLAVGHRRGRMVRKLSAEAAIVATVGWGAGIALGLAVLWAYRTWALEPKGILMEVLDATPLLFSLTVPALSALVSAVALARRLHGMDPVNVIQRRGA